MKIMNEKIFKEVIFINLVEEIILFEILIN